jgi:hypothetical protein
MIVERAVPRRTERVAAFSIQILRAERDGDAVPLAVRTGVSHP